MRFAVRSHLVSAILHRLTRRLRLEPEAVTATHASIGRTRKSSMGEINIPHDQQGAIAAIDARELDRLIEQAIREERSSDLHRLALANCGSYIATKLHSFRSEEHTSELQSLMRLSYAVFCLKKKTITHK